MAWLIDVAVPENQEYENDLCYQEEVKYEELTRPIQRMWRTEDVRMVPTAAISSSELVRRGLAENLKMMELGNGILMTEFCSLLRLMVQMFLGEM